MVQNIIFRVETEGNAAIKGFRNIGNEAQKTKGIVDKFGNSITTKITEPVKQAEAQVKKSTGVMGDSFGKLKGMIAGAFTIYGIMKFVDALETVAKSTDKTGDKWEEMVGGMKNLWNDFLKSLSGAKVDLSTSFEAGKEAAKMIDELREMQLSSQPAIANLYREQLKLIQEIRGGYNLDDEFNKKEKLTLADKEKKINEALAIQREIGKIKMDEANLELQTFLTKHKGLGITEKELKQIVLKRNENIELIKLAEELNKKRDNLLYIESATVGYADRMGRIAYKYSETERARAKEQLQAIGKRNDEIKKMADSLEKYNSLNDDGAEGEKQQVSNILTHIEEAKKLMGETGQLRKILLSTENLENKESEKQITKWEKIIALSGKWNNVTEEQLELLLSLSDKLKEINDTMYQLKNAEVIDVKVLEDSEYKFDNFTEKLLALWLAFRGKVKKENLFSEEELKNIEQFGKSITSIYESVMQIITTAYEQKIKQLDDLISYQQKKVDEAYILAEKGNVEILRIQKERQANLEKERAKILRQQKAFAMAQIALETAVAVAKTAASMSKTTPIGVAVSIAAVIAAIAAGIAKAQSMGGFKKGGYTGDGRSDEVAGTTHKKEFVFNEEKTRKYRPIFEQVHKGRLDLNDIIKKEVLLMNVSGNSRNLEKKMDTLINLMAAKNFNAALYLDGDKITNTVNRYNNETMKIRNKAKI